MITPPLWFMNDQSFRVHNFQPTSKTIGMAGAETNNEALLRDAFLRFEKVYAQEPQHVLNLQNWAITYFYVGNYAEAWKKIALAEATPRRNHIDPRFVAALQSKMPRP